MAAKRDAAPSRSDIGLGSYRVLLIAQMISDVGEQLGESHDEIGGTPLPPAGDELRDPIEDQSAEARVILREVVDIRGFTFRRRALGCGAAVEVAGTLDLEGELGACHGDVEPRKWEWVRSRLDQAKRVAGEVAGRIGADHEQLVRICHGGEERLLGNLRHGVGGGDPLGLHGADADATCDTDVLGIELGYCLQAAHEQRLLAGDPGRRVAIEDLDIVDAVQARIGSDEVAAVLIAAGVSHADTFSRVKESILRSSVRRTTYWMVTDRVESSAWTSTPSTAITSPSQRWRAPLMRN